MRICNISAAAKSSVTATATAVVLAIPTQGFADGPTTYAAPAAAPAAFDWSGGYAGVHLGSLSSGMEFTFDDPLVDFTDSVDPDGWEGGLYGGYNWQGPNNLVYGVEAEYNWADADGETEPFGGQYYRGTINSTAALRLRVGYAQDRTLFYAAGGLAYADLGFEFVGTTPDSDSDRVSGWTLGVGAEHAFTDSLIGRIDYRYSDYGTTTFDINGNGYDVDLTTNQVRAGLAYKF